MLSVSFYHRALFDMRAKAGIGILRTRLADHFIENKIIDRSCFVEGNYAAARIFEKSKKAKKTNLGAIAGERKSKNLFHTLVINHNAFIVEFVRMV